MKLEKKKKSKNRSKYVTGLSKKFIKDKRNIRKIFEGYFLKKLEDKKKS